MKKSILLVLLAFVGSIVAEDQSVQQNLQEAMEARYRITVLGASVLGMHGGPDSIRKLGGTLIVTKKGLYGALDRPNLVSNSIKNGTRTLLAGKEEVELVPGERFYANSVTVGQDFVTIGLLSVDPRNFQGRMARVWASLNFFFPASVIKNGDVKTINAAMDQWILPADSMPNMPVNPAKTFTVAAGLPASVDLKPGMTREEIVANLGTPAQAINFGTRTWLTYPALVAVLQDGKLLSVDRAEDSAGKVSLASDPAGAEVYVDGELAGTTPTALRVPVGTHKFELKLQGKTWQQEVRVYPGADVNLSPALATASGN